MDMGHLMLVISWVMSPIIEKKHISLLVLILILDFPSIFCFFLHLSLFLSPDNSMFMIFVIIFNHPHHNNNKETLEIEIFK